MKILINNKKLNRICVEKRKKAILFSLGLDRGRGKRRRRRKAEGNKPETETGALRKRKPGEGKGGNLPTVAADKGNESNL